MLNSPSCILVVEDEPMIRFCIVDYLRKCGFQVVEAVDIDEAMTLLRSPEVRIDLVFTDVNMMGDRDGFYLARWVRAAFPGLPVILTSGVAQAADLGEELCALGPIETKPYHAASLLKRMQRVLADNSARRVKDGVALALAMSAA